MDMVYNIFLVLGLMVLLYTIGFLINKPLRKYDDISNPPLAIRVASFIGALFYLASAPIALLVIVWSSPLESSVRSELEVQHKREIEGKDNRIFQLEGDLSRLRDSYGKSLRHSERARREGYEQGYADCESGVPRRHTPLAARYESPVPIVQERPAPTPAAEAPHSSEDGRLYVTSFDGYDLCIPLSSRDSFIAHQKEKERAYFATYGAFCDQVYSCLEASTRDFLLKHSPVTGDRAFLLLATALAFSSDSVVMRYPIFSALCDKVLNAVSSGDETQLEANRAIQFGFIAEVTHRWLPRPGNDPSERCDRSKWLRVFGKFVLRAAISASSFGSLSSIVAMFEDFEDSAVRLLDSVPKTRELT